MRQSSVFQIAFLLLSGLCLQAQTLPCSPLGPNLILNPSFEQGYYGFTSDFGRGVNNGTHCACATQGWIIVTDAFPHVSYSCQQYPAELSAQYGGPNTETSSDPMHPSNTSVVGLGGVCTIPIPDHTSGNGFFLTIDPDGCPDRAYWRQRLQVCPNTNYYFSVWVYNVSGLPAPTFHFAVDGVAVTPVTSFPEHSWVQSSALWNSGNAEGSVFLELRNDLPGCIENDVAIDDLFFGVCGGVALSSGARFRYCPNDPDVSIRLSGQAFGFSNPEYQWQKQETSSGVWQDIAGEKDTFLQISGPGSAEAGLYRLLAAEQGNVGVRTCRLSSPLMELIANPTYDIVDTVNICLGQSYEGHTKPGIFPKKLQTFLGCDSLHSLDLRVRGSVHIYIPNVFSPNDDGYNDVIQPILSETDLDHFLWQVYDRWGNLVFESRDPETAWDGYFRGKLCPAAVYAYTLKMEILGCQEAMLSGDLLLLR